MCGRNFAAWRHWNRDGEYITYTVPPGGGLRVPGRATATRTMKGSTEHVLQGAIQIMLAPCITHDDCLDPCGGDVHGLRHLATDPTISRVVWREHHVPNGSESIASASPAHPNPARSQAPSIRLLLVRLPARDVSHWVSHGSERPEYGARVRGRPAAESTRRPLPREH